MIYPFIRFFFGVLFRKNTQSFIMDKFYEFNEWFREFEDSKMQDSEEVEEDIIWEPSVFNPSSTRISSRVITKDVSCLIDNIKEGTPQASIFDFHNILQIGRHCRIESSNDLKERVDTLVAPLVRRLISTQIHFVFKGFSINVGTKQLSCLEVSKMILAYLNIAINDIAKCADITLHFMYGGKNEVAKACDDRFVHIVQSTLSKQGIDATIITNDKFRDFGVHGSAPCLSWSYRVCLSDCMEVDDQCNKNVFYELIAKTFNDLDLLIQQTHPQETVLDDDDYYNRLVAPKDLLKSEVKFCGTQLSLIKV